MAKRFQTLSDPEIVTAIQRVQDYGCQDERKPMLTALYSLLANTGLRVSEAVAYTRGTTPYRHALRWQAVDFERGECTVTTLKQAKVKGRRSETIEDTIPLDAKTLAVLQAWKGNAQSADYIFPISRRVAYNIWQKILHLACIKPIRLHALRHSAVTRWIEQTGDLSFAQAMARHRSVSSTAQYVHCRHMAEKFKLIKGI